MDAYTVPCRRCSAAPGKGCSARGFGSKRFLKAPHAIRVKDADAVAQLLRPDAGRPLETL